MKTTGTYISYNHLVSTIKRNLHKIPNDVSLFVGVPRSGMIPVSIIAEYMNKSFMDINSFLKGEQPKMGDREIG